jgi:hypothetical protein
LNAHGVGLLVKGEPLPQEKLRCKMLIMTSQENHDETVNFISKQNNYFGGSAKNFEFFQ